MDIVSQPWKSPRQTWGRWGMHVGDRVGAYSVTGLTGMVGLSLNQCGRQNIFTPLRVGGPPTPQVYFGSSHAHTHIYIYTYVYIIVGIYIYIYIYVHIHTHIYIYIYL